MNIPSLPMNIFRCAREFNLRKFVSNRFYLPQFEIMKANIDQRNMNDMVSKNGFEHVEYHVETEDGYILQMHRICKKISYNVVYF
mmetsp:Transcript_11262/g.7797  ORF Transcript_11262/g.7797 Transcript_11262/m.7797 type:complete len:85 (+) Transcript_11262:394-648(+)